MCRKIFADWLFRLAMGVFPVAAAILLTGYAQPPSVLEQVVRAGELRVVTTIGPTTYYVDGHGPAGFEYELARMFAGHLGVELRLVTPDSAEDIIPMIARREADLAAAGLIATEEHEREVRFGPAYHEASQQLVYRRGMPRPDSLASLDDTVVSGTRHASLIRTALNEHADVQWRSEPGLETGDLLARLWRREIPYIIADSNEIKVSQRYYPELSVAFDLTPPQPLAWAFPRLGDDSLVRAAEEFFAALGKNGDLERLRERYYGHVNEFDYVGVRRFLRHVEQRLPKYSELFRRAAIDHQHDWRLLAAVGYQESHWNPKAVSPTGVRGIMMLTRRTAKELGIDDRIDPGNSITGGARYLQQILKRLPTHIEEPDRTWMALAAYNVGYGHLQDARALARQNGGDPDHWADVMKTLPLLTEKQWYRKTRYGYARGMEAVRYVQNIRGYYDMLVWQTGPQAPATATVAAATPAASPLL
ncbi:MAG: membrane-bound lytic murein transglycosylase MltF [Gammaproteobacteria bacterium]|jgi:membrane-bound lytic murein transglycosylase F|nr:membrane-bound lytic murein transglycosylase MltF [Gammaproteobacteria bacterium]